MSVDQFVDHVELADLLLDPELVVFLQDPGEVIDHA